VTDTADARSSPYVLIKDNNLMKPTTTWSGLCFKKPLKVLSRPISFSQVAFSPPFLHFAVVLCQACTSATSASDGFFFLLSILSFVSVNTLKEPRKVEALSL